MCSDVMYLLSSRWHSRAALRAYEWKEQESERWMQTERDGYCLAEPQGQHYNQCLVLRKGLGSVLVGEKGLKLLQCKRGESFQLQQRQPATPSLCVCVCVSSTCQLLYECLWLCCGLGLLSSRSAANVTQSFFLLFFCTWCVCVCAPVCVFFLFNRQYDETGTYDS